MRQYRLSLLCAAGLFPTLLLAALCVAQEKTPPNPVTAQQEFKNVQILKGLSEDALYATMRGYDKDLGVGCGFCHVVDDRRSGFEKDDRPQKLKARQMLLMTRALNKSHPVLKGSITCRTCHAGKKQPVSSPP